MNATEMLDLVDALIKRAQNNGADSADAILVDGTDISISRRLGELEELERAESTGIGLRVLVGKQQAIVSGSDLKQDALDELAERAVSIAKQAPEDPYTGLADEAQLARNIADLELEDSQEEPTPEWLLERCDEAEETALAVKGITNSEGASASYAHNRIALATSTGFANSYGSTSSSLSVSVLAGEGTAMERDYDYALVRHRANLPSAKKIGQTAAERTLKRLGAKKVNSCQVPVVFDPRVGKQLLSSFAGAISGSAVARGTSFLKEEMGKTVFNDAITIIDDPQRKQGLGSKPFDAEGLAAEPLQLVKDGTLQQWLLSCRSARQLGLTSNGRASRGLSSSPSPSTTNLHIEPGKVSVSELIGDIKNGFYVTETFGMGINTVTGDYSQGAAGFWIENGEILYPVSELTIAGKLQDMFKQLTPANDLEFKYRTNTPTLRVEKMTIAGN